MLSRNKTADVLTPLQPHQQRVVERIQQQPGLVVAHGLGSGKTLSSIAAAEALGGPTAVLLPAALQANYQKEIAKHVEDPAATYDISSLQRAARSGVTSPGDLLIVDEAHRLRDPSSGGHQAVAESDAAKRLLLTGTPLYNKPSDLASLVNLAARAPILPEQPEAFEARYLGQNTVNPGWFARHIRGIKPGGVPQLKNKEELRKILRQWVDYHENSTEGFPERRERIIPTTMGPKQLAVYNTMLGKAPQWVRYKVENRLPLNKSEAKNINAFSNAVRQVAVSPGGFDITLDPLSAAKSSPKLTQAFNNFSSKLQDNPRHKAVVYSNYLESGINPYEALLQEAGVPYGKFTGDVSKEKRDQMVRDYNADKLKVLLVSSAGSEGLDLKGTRQIQVLDPHWNKEKLEQVIGRGIRYKSHHHLPPEERNVDVEHYVSVNPEPGRLARMLGMSRGGSIDEYLRQTAEDKDAINEQIRQLLQEEMPMKKNATDAHLADRRAGVSDALNWLGLYSLKVANVMTESEPGSEDDVSPETEEELERHLDDLGIATMAAPIAADMLGSGLVMVPAAPIQSVGHQLINNLGVHSPLGHSHLRELAALGLVAPSVGRRLSGSLIPDSGET